MDSAILKNTLPKLIVIGLLSYSLINVIKCPCDSLLACHFNDTVAALSAALGTILFLNAAKFD
jgi:hypothetical protein